MPEPITIGTVLGVGITVISTILNAVLSTIEKFGYLPLALFMMGLLYVDSGWNIIGGSISFVTKYFWGFEIASFTLFMLVVASVMLWFFWKVKDFNH